MKSNPSISRKPLAFAMPEVRPWISRRSFLRLGGIAPFGLGFSSSPSVGSAMSSAMTSRAPTAMYCILIWLDGGPSHLETWDPKTEVPQDVRGPFNAIDTNVPGIRISEHLTRCAKIADKLAIVRSLTSPLGEHGIANHYLLTGYQPSTQIQYPSMGSVVGQHFGRTNPLPNYVVIPESKSSMGAGFLGQEAEPFSILGDPASPDFRVRHLDYYPGVSNDRIQNRRQMLDAIERRFSKDSSKEGSDFEQAFRLVDSAESKRVFDLQLEPAEVRAEYGPRTFGQCCLMARRLVEHGVRFVTVVQPGWDTHDQLTRTLRDGYSGAKTGVGLIPTLDTGLSALIADLQNRGLLESTLVVVMGEFGRTPKLNTRGGRDHWPRVFSAVLAGGGTPGGIVVGSSDRVGESPKDRPVTPSDLVRTVYRKLGIDPDATLWTNDKRPIQINQHGNEIEELL